MADLLLVTALFAVLFLAGLIHFMDGFQHCSACGAFTTLKAAGTDRDGASMMAAMGSSAIALWLLAPASPLYQESTALQIWVLGLLLVILVFIYALHRYDRYSFRAVRSTKNAKKPAMQRPFRS